MLEILVVLPLIDTVPKNDGLVILFIAAKLLFKLVLNADVVKYDDIVELKFPIVK